MSYSGILDLDENPLTSFNFSLPFSGSKQFDIKVPCKVGRSLKSINGLNVFYYGRFNSGDSWTDLSVGLDLSAFPNIVKVVHIKIETDEASTPKEQTTRLFLQ